jgi:hypothetical protein
MQPCHGIEFCASSDMGSDMGLVSSRVFYKYGSSVDGMVPQWEFVSREDRISRRVFTNTVQARMVPQWEVCILDTPWRHSRGCLIRLDAT